MNRLAPETQSKAISFYFSTSRVEGNLAGFFVRRHLALEFPKRRGASSPPPGAAQLSPKTTDFQPKPKFPSTMAPKATEPPKAPKSRVPPRPSKVITARLPPPLECRANQKHEQATENKAGYLLKHGRCLVVSPGAAVSPHGINSCLVRVRLFRCTARWPLRWQTWLQKTVRRQHGLGSRQ